MTDSAGLTDEEYAAILSDFGAYAETCLVVRKKNGKLASLVLNRAQMHLHREIEAQKRDTGMIRAIILKGRQQGCSSYIEGRLYWRVTQAEGVRAFILTHEQEATKNLFEMTQRYHDNCLPDFRPVTGATNAKELVFSQLDSGYRVGTAGSKGTGRSSTIQYFHGSEVAFWPHAGTHLSGVMQAVPMEPGTEVYLESTANGVGGVYYDLWKEAESGAGAYKPIFVPWYWQDEYRIKTDAGSIIITTEESELMALYGLDIDQIAWRRHKIRELKSTEVFRQEYPCTPDEAFITSGRHVFEPMYLDRAERECYKPRYRATISPGTGRISRRDDGELRVWDEPDSGSRYVIGADVAEGLEHGDYSSADVLKLPGGEQVAQWHGKIDPDRFGAVLAAIGKRYKKAMIGVERNNHGLTTLTTLRGTGYPHIYAQKDIESRSAGKETKKFGWLTTSKSKYKIIDQLAGELRDEDHGIVCKETISECRTYKVDPGGSYNAMDGCYDDRVMSRAIAGEVARSVPRGKSQRYISNNRL